ncbi:hypothetical protein CH063_12210 [Colletotrichum higginsianum]|uniref:Uncharacterized protein n=2 Tax=Colletotrichum higginsianum TaxID=80884 RepID=H1VPH6_COLHI|nr:hypothetical protein CH63R_01320 [Colletotrichum higginsianum IMI 349063]OBR16140.1 hypothetical protein CH63R_01320 [Colletotrichum higginsianum IMI 349063]TID05145.1 hypothetical protein CH35J_002140 [Colletotrichum higginsianum]CCF42131.1 hypothetical protein CH063_12210 [Colletotrichum higginsianum]
MPKRSLDASNLSPTMPTVRAQKKTERSHEENQERAYIAASRRADRSIEARVQSAKMASEIHKKRTGKGFKISEAIVQAEEMYEEEEDDMPRSYRMLAAHLQTGSPEFDYRVNAFLANRVAMASMVAGLRNEEWAQNPINKMFAEQFPNANKQAQALSRNITNSMYYQPVARQSTGQQQQQQTSPVNAASSPMSPSFGTANFQSENQQYQRESTQSLASPMEMATPIARESALSPPALSPSSEAAAGTPSTRAASNFPSPMMTMNHSLFSPESSFTAELPMDVKMMAPNLDINDPMSHMFIGNPLQQQVYYPDTHSLADLKHDQHLNDMALANHEYFDGDLNPYASRYEDNDLQGEGTTPAPNVNDSWDAFLDFGEQSDTGAVEPTL